MFDMVVNISSRPLYGTVKAVPSKSELHRLLICATLSKSDTLIYANINTTHLSDDIASTIECLTALGAVILLTDGVINVSPPKEFTSHANLQCGESGSTLRFLLPVAAALSTDAAFHGKGRLPDRPVGHLRNLLASHGCAFSSDTLPFIVSGNLHGGDFVLPGSVSSQYVSGLLFALPLLAADSYICIDGTLESRPYLDMTLESLRLFGIVVNETTDGFFVPGGQIYTSPVTIHAFGDWSNAAFWLTAGAVGGDIICEGLSLESIQGDRSVLSLLERFGADVIADNAVHVRKNKLSGQIIDAVNIPDLVPILSVIASVCEGETVFTGVARLRIKESDRLVSTANFINNLGGEAYVYTDGSGECLRIVGRSALSGGTVDGCNDHRIVMAAAIASSVCNGNVIINGAEAVNKSYPDFFNDFAALGGSFTIL